MSQLVAYFFFSFIVLDGQELLIFIQLNIIEFMILLLYGSVSVLILHCTNYHSCRPLLTSGVSPHIVVITDFRICLSNSWERPLCFDWRHLDL